MTTVLPPDETSVTTSSDTRPAAPPTTSLHAQVGALLLALGQSLSAMTLYGPDHPSRTAARERARDRLLAVLVMQAPLRLTLLDGEVIVERDVLHEFRGWDWARRLAAAGVQRVEFNRRHVEADEFTAWLDLVHAALAPGAPAIEAPVQIHGIHFGPVGLIDSTGEANAEAATGANSADGVSDASDGARELVRVAGMTEELEALACVETRLAERASVPVAEVEAIVRGLALTMQGEQGSLLPLIALKSSDQYTTVHACNVAMLSMGLAEQLGFSSSDVRAIGVAALLHDVGKIRLPGHLLNKPDMLTESERALLSTHPAEGARLLGERGVGYGLAAIVAYEHHVWANGQGGYPTFRYPRVPHFVSRLVQVCDVYDALSTERPYRAAWPRARTLHHMRLQAGRELDYELLLAFFDLLGRAEKRQLLPL